MQHVSEGPTEQKTQDLLSRAIRCARPHVWNFADVVFKLLAWVVALAALINLDGKYPDLNLRVLIIVLWLLWHFVVLILLLDAAIKFDDYIQFAIGSKSTWPHVTQSVMGAIVFGLAVITANVTLEWAKIIVAAAMR